MTAPDVSVLLSTGEVVLLRDLYAEKSLTLVFLRHFGCTFCKDQVAELRVNKALHVVFVGMGNPDETEQFRTRMRSPHPFICDPDQVLYRAFGLGKGTFNQVLGPKIFARGFGATLRGHWIGLPVGDPWQMPGIFLIEPTGEVSWEYRSESAADVVRLASISAEANQQFGK